MAETRTPSGGCREEGRKEEAVQHQDTGITCPWNKIWIGEDYKMNSGALQVTYKYSTVRINIKDQIACMTK